ncbi:MAG: hypothetical protein ACREMZ_15105 [Gemmatimonadales bacterium]
MPGYETGQNKAALRRTFERDKEELRAFGVPIETVTTEGEIVGYRLQPQYFYLPYLTLRSEGTTARPSRVDRFGYRALKQAWELGAGDAVSAVVSFRGNTGAAAAALRLGEVIEDSPENRRFRVRRTDAFARWLLSFAGDPAPVSPPELVDEFHRLVSETLAHHSSSRPPTRPPVRLTARPPVRPERSEGAEEAGGAFRHHTMTRAGDAPAAARWWFSVLDPVGARLLPPGQGQERHRGQLYPRAHQVGR